MPKTSTMSADEKKTAAILILLFVAWMSWVLYPSGNKEPNADCIVLRTVSQNDLDPWPLTVSPVDVLNRNGALVIKTNGQSFALNGMARSQGYPDLDPIWKDSTSNPGTKIPITELIEIAAAL